MAYDKNEKSTNSPLSEEYVRNDRPSITKQCKNIQSIAIDATQIQEQQVEDIVEGVPGRFQKTYLKALEGKAQSKEAIKAKCLECVGFEDAPSRIRTCTVSRCPLWRYRPYTKGKN